MKNRQKLQELIKQKNKYEAELTQKIKQLLRVFTKKELEDKGWKENGFDGQLNGFNFIKNNQRIVLNNHDGHLTGFYGANTDPGLICDFEHLKFYTKK